MAGSGSGSSRDVALLSDKCFLFNQLPMAEVRRTCATSHLSFI